MTAALDSFGWCRCSLIRPRSNDVPWKSRAEGFLRIYA